MAFNGSGTHVRVHDWTTDLTNTVPVTASRMDAEHDDMSTALSLTICRDGQSTTTARIPFAVGTSAAAGSASAASYAQTNDTNTGLYFPAVDQWGLSAGGTGTLTSTATALTATVAFNFTGAATPASSDGAALGSATLMWSDLFLASGAVINFNNGNATITHAAGSLTTAVTTFSITGALTVSTTAAITGNATFGGTLGVTGATTLSSTLAAGNTTITGTLAASGDVAVNTNKFTVAAASGNTAVAGTLAVTGAQTNTGALSANNAAGILGVNTAKAFVCFTTDGSAIVTIKSSFNVSGVAIATVGGQNGWRVTFSNALSDADYTAIGNGTLDSSFTTTVTFAHRHATDKATTTFDFVLFQSGSGGLRNNISVNIIFLSDT